jgi:hypothetical protein
MRHVPSDVSPVFFLVSGLPFCVPAKSCSNSRCKFLMSATGGTLSRMQELSIGSSSSRGFSCWGQRHRSVALRSDLSSGAANGREWLRSTEASEDTRPHLRWINRNTDRSETRSGLAGLAVSIDCGSAFNKTDSVGCPRSATDGSLAISTGWSLVIAGSG